MSERRDTKSQRERFEQAARELRVEVDEEKLKEALRKIAPSEHKGAKDKPSEDG